MDPKDGGHWGIQHFKEGIGKEGNNGVTPHKRVHVRQEALDDVHEHRVKGGYKQDGLLGEEGRHH